MMHAFQHSDGYIKWLMQSIKNVVQGKREVCLLCGAAKSNQTTLKLCAKCVHDIPWIKHLQCMHCGRAAHCPDCKRNEIKYIHANRSAVSYTPVMKQWLALYKFRGQEMLLPLFVDMMIIGMETHYHPLLAQRKANIIVSFVPTSRERNIERGFNQAQQLAEGVALYYDLDCMQLVDRIQHTEKQSRQNREQRKIALRDAFHFNPASTHVVSQWRQRRVPMIVLLIDDVYTTGSTLNACAKCIVQALPDAVVYSLCWSRA
ncbi:ComF family protein [Longirhabdus pacifica]|uniref:ComF family protein n=1 Tax=Longirhabdus pacifica TaxID=2305227 RepID=UPI001008E23A|nr:ComF family protein [Longirhabdus pacifica]